MNSRHWDRDREARREAIRRIGTGNVIKTVEIDRHHKNGPEIHEISDTGIITVFNKNTHKMITQLIARPGQIRRYFTEDERIPKGLLNIARQHQELNLNYVQKNLFLKKLLTNILIYNIIQTVKGKEKRKWKEKENSYQIGLLLYTENLQILLKDLKPYVKDQIYLMLILR